MLDNPVEEPVRLISEKDQGIVKKAAEKAQYSRRSSLRRSSGPGWAQRLENQLGRLDGFVRSQEVSLLSLGRQLSRFSDQLEQLLFVFDLDAEDRESEDSVEGSSGHPPSEGEL